MDFKLDKESKLAKDALRDFLKKEITPIVSEYEAESKYITKKLFKKLAPFGLVSGFVPEKYGGDELSYVTMVGMVEELARSWGSLRSLTTSNSTAARLIAKFGSDSQREKFLPKLMSMDEFICFALTEPNVGSDAASIETEAVRKGDYYVLNGTKTLITGGSLADVYCVYASTDKSKKGKGVSTFLVRKDETEVLTTDFKKMGNRAAPLSELVFRDSKVPVVNRLGEEGEGFKFAKDGLNSGRCLVSFGVIGVAQAALEASIKYVKSRHQFGKPIGSFQLVQEMIVDMAMKVDISRLLGYRAAVLLDAGKKCTREASFAKLYATEAAVKITNNAIQVHGGYGYTEEYPVERYYRDVRHLTMAEGTSEIQKLILGRNILKISAMV